MDEDTLLGADGEIIELAEPNFKLRDTLERLLWTVVAAMGGGFIGAGLFETSMWQAMATSGIIAAVNYITIVARRRLAVLPDPGAAIAEEVATETYRQITVGD